MCVHCCLTTNLEHNEHPDTMKNYNRLHEGPMHTFSYGKRNVEKTRVASVVDSTLKPTSNMNNTMMDVGVMNMLSSLLEDMLEVTCRDLQPCSHRYHTFSPSAHLLQRIRPSTRHFEQRHQRLTESFMMEKTYSRNHLCLSPRSRAPPKASSALSLSDGDSIRAGFFLSHFGPQLHNQFNKLAPL